MRKVILFALVAVFLFTGCLTCQYKEYRFEMKTKSTGLLTIKYVNILSIVQGVNVTEEMNKDFTELLTDYLNGDKFKEYKGAKLVSRRLFEEKGQLCGEVVLQFDSLASAMLYQYDSNSPYMYLGKDVVNEKFVSSNGKKGPEQLPAIFWDKNQKELLLLTELAEPGDSVLSLLNHYKKAKPESSTK